MMLALQNSCGAFKQFMMGACWQAFDNVSYAFSRLKAHHLHFVNVCSGAVKGLGFATLASGPAFIALGGQSSAAQLSAATGAIEERWEGSKHPLTAIAPSQNGARCVLAGASVDIWDFAAKTRLHRFSGHAVSHVLPCGDRLRKAQHICHRMPVLTLK